MKIENICLPPSRGRLLHIHLVVCLFVVWCTSALIFIFWTIWDDGDGHGHFYIVDMDMMEMDMDLVDIVDMVDIDMVDIDMVDM